MRPGSRDSAPQIRRSSTSRSIGARSSYNSSFADPKEDPRYREDDDSSEAANTEDNFGRPSPIGRQNGTSNGVDHEREEADEHVDRFVANQLERVRTGESEVGVYEDEFEAQLDN